MSYSVCSNRTYRIETDETSKKHEAIAFMAPYLDVDNYIEELHKTYPEIELEVVPYSEYNSVSEYDSGEKMICRISVHFPL